MRKIVCLAGCCLIAIASFCQTLQPKQLKEDFDTLRRGLEEAHGGLYRFHSRADIDMMFTQQRKMLETSMGQYAFYGRLARVLAYIGDGHMKLDFDPARLAAQVKPLFFPFQVINDQERTFILTNDTQNDRVIRPGMELLTINGLTVAKIRQKILPCLIGDGYGKSGKAASLQRSFSQNYWLFVDTSSIFNVRTKDAAGKLYTVTVKGLTNAQRAANRKQNPVNAETLTHIRQLDGDPNNLSLRFSANGTAFLRIHSFTGDRFRQEIDSLFGIVLEKKTRALVLDLRSNGGGLDEWGAYLATKFAKRSFRYFDHIHARVLIPSFADWKEKPPVDLVNGMKQDPNGGYLVQPLLNQTVAEQQPATHPYTGKVVVLINGGTFSAASDFCAILRNLVDAIFVGEETGGGYEGNTSGLNVILKLPNSGFKVNIHLWDYWSAVKPAKHKGRGTIPDYLIIQKPDDWLNGTDDQYEFALSLCR